MNPSLKKDVREPQSNEVLDTLPLSPGVYLMKDGTGRVIYVGKAKNLRSRVRSYFRSPHRNERPQVPYLVHEVSGIDYFVTEAEREALILESTLIKKHKPKYNILLKDDKNYASIRLDPKERFPRLTYTRRVLNDGAVYFGPFSSTKALRKTLLLIHRIFPLRDCTDTKFKRHNLRPCLNYQMGLCLGPCAGKATEEEYREVVSEARVFLRGRMENVIKLIRTKMEKASEELRFEDAARYRDQIKLLEKDLVRDKLISKDLIDRDAVGLWREGDTTQFVVVFVRGGSLFDKMEYSFRDAFQDDETALQEFVEQFYGEERFIPDEILLPLKFEGIEVLSEWLSERKGSRVKATVPRGGSKLKLVEFAKMNAEESFRRESRARGAKLAVLEGIKGMLRLRNTPLRVECFDISNIQGDMAVGSMVRFEEGEPVKSKYRRFRIKTVSGANDYAMMYEILTRRYRRVIQEGNELPELILIDGGKGQLNVACQVLGELGIQDKLDLASIAKAREEGEVDKIYIPQRKDPVISPFKGEELLLLMRIRDEAHRFAITYHKNLRRKRAFESALDSIPWIGKGRKKALLTHFRSVAEIKKATVDEIARVPGINRKIAQRLLYHLD